MTDLPISKPEGRKTTLEDIEKARKVIDMWINNKVKRHNQDKWLELINVVPSVDGAEDILKVLAFYLNVPYDRS